MRYQRDMVTEVFEAKQFKSDVRSDLWDCFEASIASEVIKIALRSNMHMVLHVFEVQEIKTGVKMASGNCRWPCCPLVYKAIALLFFVRLRTSKLVLTDWPLMLQSIPKHIMVVSGSATEQRQSEKRRERRGWPIFPHPRATSTRNLAVVVDR